MSRGAPPNLLARTLRAFFTEHLARLRGLSPHTILSYRDSLALLLRFTATHRRRAVAALDLADLDPETIAAFLQHLEAARRSRPSTRNVRLAAIHTFFRYVASQHPDCLEHAQRILGIPFKRARARPVEYLEYEEIAAVLGTIDRTTRDGRRDYALVATLFNTGARVQELLDLRAHDLQLTHPVQVRLVGKGRKERWCPLWPQSRGAARLLRRAPARSPRGRRGLRQSPRRAAYALQLPAHQVPEARDGRGARPRRL